MSRGRAAPAAARLALHAATALAATLLAATVLAAAPAPLRVEARSADLLAVGIVEHGHMSIHVSRLTDNAPVRNAVLNVLLRGVLHPTVAEPDGSYALTTPDLDLPGAAGIEFQVRSGASTEKLASTLTGGTAAPVEDKSTARQLWWWVLNFAVCIGFLMLLSRRRKAAKTSTAA